MSISRFVIRVVKGTALFVLFALVGITCLLCLLWLDHKRETTLLPPTGTFAVGRTVEEWNDPARSELLAPAQESRKLITWVWYPAQKEASPQFALYLPPAWQSALEHHKGVLLSSFFTRDLSRVRTHSQINAELAPQESQYPIVLLRAGLSALTTDYTAIAEDLASHGYVVVGIDAPYRTVVAVLSNGEIVERAPQNNADLVGGQQQEELAIKLVQAWSSDMSFAVDELQKLSESDNRFRNRLDLRRIGVVGHSLGGATTLQFCHDDARFYESVFAVCVAAHGQAMKTRGLGFRRRSRVFFIYSSIEDDVGG